MFRKNVLFNRKQEKKYIYIYLLYALQKYYKTKNFEKITTYVVT